MARMLIVAALLIGTAQAQTVIVKCVDAKGQVAYTTDACPPGQSIKSTRTYAAIHDDPAAQARPQDIERQQDGRDRGNGSRVDRSGASNRSEPTERDKRKLACANAKRKAEQARGKGYSNRKLQSLDKAGVDACFGL